MDRISLAETTVAEPHDPEAEPHARPRPRARLVEGRPWPGSDSLGSLFQRTERYRARTDLFREGVRADRCCLILDGWACRYRVLHDGRRAVIAFLMPGDLCGAWLDTDGTMDHGIGTLCEVTAASIGAEQLLGAVARSPRIAEALRCRALACRLLLADWLVSIGHSSSHHRVARLLCELWDRAGSAKLIREDILNLPITQDLVADALGLTTVHVNRTVQALRRLGLIEWTGRQLKIPDPARLQAEAYYSATRTRR
jgi:CRP-like cAMP-binding protein